MHRNTELKHRRVTFDVLDLSNCFKMSVDGKGLCGLSQGTADCIQQEHLLTSCGQTCYSIKLANYLLISHYCPSFTVPKLKDKYSLHSGN
jgi:hypothetical protein